MIPNPNPNLLNVYGIDFFKLLLFDYLSYMKSSSDST